MMTTVHLLRTIAAGTFAAMLPGLAQVRAQQPERSFLQEVLAVRAQDEGFTDTGALDHRRHQSSSAKRG